MKIQNGNPFLQTAMDRPDSIKGATAMQCLIGLGYLGLGIIFLLPVNVTNEGEAFLAATIPSPPIAVGISAIGVVALLGAFGMWRGRLWGLLMALLVDLGTAATAAYITFRDFHDLDAGQVTFGVALAIVPVGWLLLPSVREFCWRSQQNY